MPIPEMRRDVRMIGPSFMPDPEHDLDIHAIDAARVDPVNSVVRYVASYLGDDDQPVKTASADAAPAAPKVSPRVADLRIDAAFAAVAIR